MPPSGAHDATLGLPPSAWPLAATRRSCDASSMNRAPRNPGTAIHLGSRSLSSDRCFCSAFRELIWSRQRPRTSAYVSRCAGTTARTCAPGEPTIRFYGMKEAWEWTAIHLEPRHGPTHLRVCSPFRGSSLSGAPYRRAPACVSSATNTRAFARAPDTRRRREARRPREPLLPPLHSTLASPV